MRKCDVDRIAEILYKEHWDGNSVRELKAYCSEWNKTDKYGVYIRNLSDGQIERVFVRYIYLYGCWV